MVFIKHQNHNVILYQGHTLYNHFWQHVNLYFLAYFDISLTHFQICEYFIQLHILVTMVINNHITQKLHVDKAQVYMQYKGVFLCKIYT